MSDGSLDQLRDRVKKLRATGDLDSAVELLSGEVETRARQLGDIHGMLGGIMRDRGDLAAACSNYDTGYLIDRSYGLGSTYNALNRLITRIMLYPETMGNVPAEATGEPLEPVDVVAELRTIQRDLQARLDRSDDVDFWAVGDLAMVAALNGDDDAMPAAVSKLKAGDPPDYVLDAYHRTIDALAQLGSPRKTELQRLRSLLA